MDGNLDEYIDSFKTDTKTTDDLDTYVDSFKTPSAKLPQATKQRWRGTKQDVDSLLNSEYGEKVRQFFNAVKWAEGGRENLIVGGKKTFNPSGDHPNIVGLVTKEGKSTAAGDYQITGSNWYGRKGQKGLKHRLGANKFDAENQLRAAILLFGDRDRGRGIEALKNGDIDTAIKIAAKDWAAVPGSNLHPGQSGRKRAEFLKRLGMKADNINLPSASYSTEYEPLPPFQTVEAPEPELTQMDENEFFFGEKNDPFGLNTIAKTVQNEIGNGNLSGLLGQKPIPKEVLQSGTEPTTSGEVLPQNPMDANVGVTAEQPVDVTQGQSQQTFEQPKGLNFDVNDQYKTFLATINAQDSKENRKTYADLVQGTVDDANKANQQVQGQLPNEQTAEMRSWEDRNQPTTGVWEDKNQKEAPVAPFTRAKPQVAARNDDELLSGSAGTVQVDFSRSDGDLTRYAMREALRSVGAEHNLSTQDIENYLNSDSGQRALKRLGDITDYVSNGGTKINVENSAINDVIKVKRGYTGKVAPEFKTELEFRSNTSGQQGAKLGEARTREDANAEAIKKQLLLKELGKYDPTTASFYLRQITTSPFTRVSQLYELYTGSFADNIKNDIQKNVEGEYENLINQYGSASEALKPKYNEDVPTVFLPTPYASEFFKGFVVDNVAPVLESGGIIQAAVERNLLGRDTEASDTTAFKVGKVFSDTFEKGLPSAPEGSLKDFARASGQAVGGIVLTVLGGKLLTGGAGLISNTNKLSPLAQKIAEKYPYILGGMQGVAQQGSEAYKRAKTLGATEDQALFASLLSIPGGLTEGLSDGLIVGKLNRIKKLDAVTNGSFSKRIVAKLKQGAKDFGEGGITEYVEEVTQGISQEAISKLAYDKDKRTFREVLKDIDEVLFTSLIAIPVGGVLGAGAGLMSQTEEIDNVSKKPFADRFELTNKAEAETRIREELGTTPAPKREDVQQTSKEIQDALTEPTIGSQPVTADYSGALEARTKLNNEKTTSQAIDQNLPKENVQAKPEMYKQETEKPVNNKVEQKDDVQGKSGQLENEKTDSEKDNQVKNKANSKNETLNEDKGIKSANKEPYELTQSEYNTQTATIIRESLKDFPDMDFNDAEANKNYQDIQKERQRLKSLPDGELVAEANKDNTGQQIYSNYEYQHGKPNHRKKVEQALKDGKTVPAEVLKDYPDLAEKYVNDQQTTQPQSVQKPSAPSNEKPLVSGKKAKGKVRQGSPALEKKASKFLKKRVVAENAISEKPTVAKSARVRDSRTVQPSIKIASEYGDAVDANQYDQVIVARDENGVGVGEVEVSFMRNEPDTAFVKMVEVVKEKQRQGIATAMYDWIKEQNPEVTKIKTLGNFSTSEGKKFRQSYDAKDTQKNENAKVSDTLKNEFPKLKQNISEDDKFITLGVVVVPKENQNQGTGTQFMNRLVELADQKGKTVILSPTTEFGATSKARLKKFYKQFGFVENKGRNKDYTISEEMYRLPDVKENLTTESESKPTPIQSDTGNKSDNLPKGSTIKLKTGTKQYTVTKVEDGKVYVEGQKRAFKIDRVEAVESETNEPLRKVSDISEFDSADYIKRRDAIPLEKNSKGELLAPNQEVSNLQNEVLWRTVRTDEFKQFFGDWLNNPEDASKVVDSNGEPKTVYHGTNKEFEVFDRTKGQLNDAGWLGAGLYFYGVKSEAEQYKRGNDATLVQAFLNIREPYYAEGEDMERLSELDDIDVSQEFTDNLIDEGYDGVDYNGDLREEYVAFNPNQIKSIFNTGEFSQDNDSILRKVSDSTPSAPFYSQLERTIEQKMPNKASKEQILGLINKNAVKKEEVDWLGLETFLDEQTGKSIAKDDVLEFIRENQADVQEVVKGGYSPEIAKLYAELEVKNNGRDFDDWNESDIETWMNERGDPQTTEYQKYTLQPYGDNYKEFLITLPKKDVTPKDIDTSNWRVKTERTYNANTPFQTEREIKVVDSKGKTVLYRSVFTGTDAEAIKDASEYRAKENAKSETKKQNYQSSHFKDTPNVLAHIRFDERTDANGNRTLHIAEIQSDIHADARKLYTKEVKRVAEKKGIDIKDAQELVPDDFGYSDNLRNINSIPLKASIVSGRWLVETHDGEIVGKINLGSAVNASEAITLAREIHGTENLRDGKKVPNFPFKKSYSHLAFKRALRYAVENNFDAVSWDIGDVQADRYSLAKQVESIKVKSTPKFATVNLKPLDGKSELSFVVNRETQKLTTVNNTGTTEEFDAQLQDKPLDEVVGKEMAEKILEVDQAENWETFEGDDLKVGGRGMKVFYDQMLPNFVNKYVKKWGGKVGNGSLTQLSQENVEEAESIASDPVRWEEALDPNNEMPFDESTYEERLEVAIDAIGEFNGTEKQQIHSLKITDKMRDSVMQGQPLFKLSDQEQLRQQELKNLSQKGEIDQDVFDAIDSTVKDGTLHINSLETAEIIRLADELNSGKDSPVIEGTFLNPSQVKGIIVALNSMANSAEAMGYDVGKLDDLIENIEKASEGKGTVPLGFGSEAIKHELTHEAGYLGVDEDADKALTNWRTGLNYLATATTRIAKNFQKAVENYQRKIGTPVKADQLRPHDLARYAEEVFTHISDGDTLGLTPKESAEVAVELALAYADARKADAKRLGKPIPTTQEALRTYKSTNASEIIKNARKESKRRNDGKASQSQKQTGDGQNSGKTDPQKETAETSGKTQRLELDNRLKNRQYAETLRETGRTAYQGDVQYLPESEKEWSDNARAIIARSEEANPNDPYAQAIKEFNSENQNKSFRVVLGTALIDHLGSIGDYKGLDEVADSTVKLVGTAAQALRASQVASKYDFAKAIQIASKAVKKTGEALTENEIEDLKNRTARYASASANETSNQIAIEEALEELRQTNDEITELHRINAELEASNKAKAISEAKAKKEAQNAKAVAKYWKNKFKDENPAKARSVGSSILRKELALQAENDIDLLTSVFGASATLKMVAWHGSPHLFDKFSIDAIGTGEGAQAYGYGLYFASKESIADHYKKTLADENVTYKGEIVNYNNFYSTDNPNLFHTLNDVRTQVLLGEAKPVDATRIKYKKKLKQLASNPLRGVQAYLGTDTSNWELTPDNQKLVKQIQTMYSKGLTQLKTLDNSDFKQESSGAKYKVDLKPSEDEYLLWDKPLSEQSEKVQKALFSGGRTAFANKSTQSHLTGGQFYKSLDDNSGGLTKNPEMSSAHLNSLGIRGIKYLDGTSRNKGEGSFNYVLFDDADVEITETLKMVAEKPLAPEAEQALIRQVQRSYLADTPVSYEQAINELREITKGAVSDEQLKQIHATAMNQIKRKKVDLSKLSATERKLAENRLANRKVRSEHRKEARKFEKSLDPLNALSPYVRKIVKKVQSSDIDNKDKVTAGIILMTKVPGAKAWHKAFADAYGGTQSENEPIFKQAVETRQEMSKDIQAEMLQKRAERENWSKSLVDFQAKLLTAQKQKKDAKKSLDAHYREISKSQMEKTIDKILLVPDVMRTMMSTGEVSQMGRQGYPTLLTFSGAYKKSLKGALPNNFKEALQEAKSGNYRAGIKAIQWGLGNPDTRYAFIKAIEENPRFKESVQYGMPYASFGESSVGDEHFPIDRIINKLKDRDYKALEKIPGLGLTASKLAKLQQRFEQAYTDPADLQRFYVYSAFADIIDSQGLSDRETDKAKKKAVYYAQILSGKGSLPKVFGEGSPAMRMMTSLGFAPNLLASRFETAFHFNPILAPVLAPKGLKGTMFKKGLRLYSIPAMLALALATIFDTEDEDDNILDVLNPLSKRFMRVIVRGTDINLDVSNGMSEFQRLMFHNAATLVYAGMTKDKDGFVETAQNLATNEQNQWLKLRFIRGKLSPAAGLGVDLYTGSDYLGHPINMKEGGYWGAVTSRFMPITYQNIYKSLHYDEARSLTKEPQTASQALENLSNIRLSNLPATLMSGTLEAVGVAANRYYKDDSSVAENVAWGMWQNKYESKDPQLSRVRSSLRNLYRLRNKKIESGKDTKGVDTQIEKIRTKYAFMPKAKLDEAIKQAKQSKFEFVTKSLSADQVKLIISVASDKEKQELQKIYDKKLKNEKKKK